MVEGWDPKLIFSYLLKCLISFLCTHTYTHIYIFRYFTQFNRNVELSYTPLMSYTAIRPLSPSSFHSLVSQSTLAWLGKLAKRACIKWQNEWRIYFTELAGFSFANTAKSLPSADNALPWIARLGFQEYTRRSATFWLMHIKPYVEMCLGTLVLIFRLDSRVSKHF